MKKNKVIFACVLMLMLSISSTVFATTINLSENQRGVDYSKYYSGSQSNFQAVGSSTQAYTTLTNKSSASKYLEAGVWEYTHSTGWTQMKSQSGYFDAGLQAVTEKITRSYTSDIVEYYHFGYCKASPQYSYYYDSFQYTADQYYD